MNQKINVGITLFLLAFCISACRNNNLENLNDIEKYIPVDLNKYNVSDLHFEKDQLTYDYTTPFNIYISMKVDNGTALQFFKSLNMVRYDAKMLKRTAESICLGAAKPEEVWRMRSISFSQPFEQKEKKVIWWKPSVDDLNSSYTANYFFYNRYNGGKPTLCKEKRNGRIVGQYSKGVMYILIECFMDFEDNKP